MRLPPPPGRLIDVGGHRLHLQCAGSGGPAVIFDAALGGSSLSWVFVQAGVARFTTACAYDRAGFGWSDRGPLPRTAGRIVLELRQLLSGARVEPPYILVGHSFGGLTARLYTRRYPAEVAGLVLLDPAYPEDWRDPVPAHRELIARGETLCRYGRFAARLGLADLVAALAATGALGAARLFARGASRGALKRADEEVLAPARKLPRELQQIARRMWTQPKFYEALGSQIGSVSASAAELDDDQDFGGRPLVVISGELNSDAGQLSRQARLAARSRRGRHLIATGSGHWIPLDRPDIVVSAIEDVVRLLSVKDTPAQGPL
ncbi:MAG TPA: alpha/beta hydrolase [Vicinamibacterales bacterium]|nr:alpha/beta hydrolase [Vicinamibacterales bacterium]